MNHPMLSFVILLAVILGHSQYAKPADAFPEFERITLDPNIGKVCYAVTSADVNGDGKPDAVAVSENRVLWYENPSWKPHVILADQTPLDNVCIAAHDIDRDGRIDFALGAGWTKIGTIHWIARSSNPDDKWTVHMLGEEKSLHRMRFADVLGKGEPQLVLSPLLASTGNGVRLLALEIPADPTKERWPTTVLSSDLNRMHNHWHLDFDGDDRVDTLTASREGVHLVTRTSDGFAQTKLGSGIAADDPDQRGAGEIKTGRLKDGTMFITTVEPMHGHTLAVYTKPSSGTAWTHHVIDSGFKRGHALWCADMDGDDDDEIVFGHSDTPDVPGVNVYDCSGGDPAKWDKHVIDAGGIATEDLVVEDLTGDGLPDILAGGRATHNVVLYVNKGKAK